jgi:AcrR family transcriptional regulator
MKLSAGSSMENLPRKERERRRRQREFLEAAEEIFSLKGFHEATIQEISEKSEFAVGSIYHMFPNKDEIFIALLRMRMEEYLSMLEERIRGLEGPLEKIKVIIRSKFEYFSEHKPFFRLYWNTALGAERDMRIGSVQELSGRYMEYLKLLAGIFEEGIRAEIFQGDDPMGMALSMEGTIHWFILYWIRHEQDEGRHPRASTVEDILLHGILRAGRQSP